MQALLRHAIGLDEAGLDVAEKTIFRERSRFFLVDNEGAKAFSIRLGEQTHLLKASAANGHFVTRLQISQEQFKALHKSASLTNSLLVFHIPAADARQRRLTSELLLLEQTGLSVISDIDDTIKVSQVQDRKELLRNTFCRPMQPVAGLAAVYQTWAKSAEAQFHYVSASPWQLYPSLAEFTRANGFPTGTFHLKYFRVKDGTFLQLFASPDKFKPGVIKPMLERFPKRRFVLVGDSGEKDPEIYGALARQYPTQVVRVLIRDVTGQPAASSRYQKAFANLPQELWQLFQEPREIKQRAF
jgi:phosphatidate phosphatase APP1